MHLLGMNGMRGVYDEQHRQTATTINVSFQLFTLAGLLCKPLYCQLLSHKHCHQYCTALAIFVNHFSARYHFRFCYTLNFTRQRQVLCFMCQARLLDILPFVVSNPLIYFTKLFQLLLGPHIWFLLELVVRSLVQLPQSLIRLARTLSNYKQLFCCRVASSFRDRDIVSPALFYQDLAKCFRQ